MTISPFIVKFIVFSVLGWIYECIYCMITEHKWQNRGFLFGPFCPIYGVCIVSADVILTFVQRHYGISAGEINIVLLFLCCMFGSAIVEYVTSYVLEKRFHARWWDYSNIPLNIKGRVSLPTSIGFGLIGMVMAKYLYTAITDIFNSIPDIITEISALVGVGILSADIALTEANLHDLLERIKEAEDKLNVRMENTYRKLEDMKNDLVLASQENRHHIISHLHMTFYHRNIINNIKYFYSEERNDILKKLKNEIKQRSEH